jgi:2-keto-4-pentenoate hydratase/2-oxohepta-3-ene-1,7-dioic acid hydratase in catechol pathway
LFKFKLFLLSLHKISENERDDMKLATFEYNDSVCCGIVTDKGIVDIRAPLKGESIYSIKELLIKGGPYLDKIAGFVDSATEFIPIDNVEFMAPVPRPGKLLALAGNYAKHIIECGSKLGLSESPKNTTTPRPFLMPSTVVAAHGAEIPYPCYSREVDYEVELAVVIGKQARCIGPDEAIGCVAGFCIANDVSARSVTFKNGRNQRPWDEFYDWLNGKWADGFLPLGPYLTTADEIDDVQNLVIELSVNGQVRQKANTSEMIYPVADIVSFLSHITTLEPGDIIATGTPEGVGMATGDFLSPGDKIDCTIEKLGTLSNTIGSHPEHLYEPLKK